ncbi:hypothetical protein BCCGELA001_30150 [Bradyrhizobium sp. CCGE-LA001]|nr:hypothetical protein BCCGELA001_30150 [Bradyrhizobium sp. CCGE-LA001]
MRKAKQDVERMDGPLIYPARRFISASCARLRGETKATNPIVVDHRRVGADHRKSADYVMHDLVHS